MSEATGTTSTGHRYLVTGAKGFIGAWIVKNLVERGHSPVVFDVDARAHRLEALLTRDQLAKVRFVQGDVISFDEVDRCIAEHGITHAIHMAAFQVPACAADPLAGARVNILGTINVFESARKRKDLIKRVVYASSAAVFGPEEFYGHGTVLEGAQLQPGTHYGVFKQCNEGNARVYFLNNGISSAGLRPWAVYGVGRDQGITSGPTKAIKAVVLGRPYSLKFTGRIDMQYADDCAKIFLMCAEKDLPGARTYTLRGAVMQVEDFIKTLGEVAPNSQGLVRAEGKALPIAADLDDSALVQDVGEVPRTPLTQGIRLTMEIFARLQKEGRLDAKDLES
ncbi:MAG: SDR family oxidoreductase [Acidobacteria bacterium]|nr:SDR family oxidoreductase [Acidobacteriota bacterium]